MSKLNTLVSTLRELARDGLRMQFIQKRRSAIHGRNMTLRGMEKDLEATKLDIATAEYEKSHVDTNHPKAKQIIADLDEDLKSLNEDKTQIEKEIEEVKKSIEKLNGEIADWETGKNKVNVEDLDRMTQKLIDQVTLSAASGKADSLDEETTDTPSETAAA